MHPTILIFEEHAVLLNMRQSPLGLDEAVTGLAEWMDEVAERLLKSPRKPEPPGSREFPQQGSLREEVQIQ